MTKAKYTIAPQFLKAEQRRQRYLDYLNANPGKLAVDIEKHMAETYGETTKTTNTTRQLIALNEIRAVKINSRNWKYFPIVTKTTTAEVFSLKQRTAAKRRMDEIHGNEVEKVNTKAEPWRYIHRPGQQIRQAGGQGCVRARVYVGPAGDRV